MAFDEPKWYAEAEAQFNVLIKQTAEKQGVPPAISLDSLKVNQSIKNILDYIFEIKKLIKVPENVSHKPQVAKKRKVPKKYKKSEEQKQKEIVSGGES